MWIKKLFQCYFYKAFSRMQVYQYTPQMPDTAKCIPNVEKTQLCDGGAQAGSGHKRVRGETKLRFTFLHHSQTQAVFWGLLPFVGLPSSNATQKWYLRQGPGFVTSSSSFCCSLYLTDGRFLTKIQTPTAVSGSGAWQ